MQSAFTVVIATKPCHTFDKKILDQEFLKMAEVTTDVEVPQEAGRVQARLPIPYLTVDGALFNTGSNNGSQVP